MAVLGCTVPWAENYNPSATQDDGSCIYVQPIGADCYEFSDIPEAEIVDQSFTLSYSLERKGWSFYHDYWPDFYMHTRTALLNLKNSVGYYNNKGPRGIYHGNITPMPFFIDVLFATNSAVKEAPYARYQRVPEPYPTFILDNINWVSEVKATGNDMTDDDQPALFNETLTAITVWNNYQTSGRITLDPQKLSLQFGNNRNSEEKWNFNKFRDILNTVGETFIGNIFSDYLIDTSKLNPNLSWYNKRLIQGKYFIIRFEFDNNNNKQITLYDLDTDVTKSWR